MLAVGTTAPDFRVEALDGGELHLASMRGKPVWLAFFRFAACPLCNYRIHELVGARATFEDRDFHRIAIFQSPAERLHDFVAKQSPPFRLVADPEMKLYGLYGLERSVLGAMTPNVLGTAMRATLARGVQMGLTDGPATRIPGDYLIDREGVIRVARRGKDIADHIPLPDVIRFLAEQGA